MIQIKSFYLKDVKGRGLILVGKGDDNNDYAFRDGVYSIIDVVNLKTIEKPSNANPECPGKCEKVYQRESGILKCKDCGKVFY